MRLGFWLALVLGGCAMRPLPAAAPEHGNLTAASVARDGDASPDASAPALVVLIERSRVVAVDPIGGAVQWSLPLVVTGHPIASAQTVYLPVRGQGVVAVDRERGTIRFTAQLPGEALVGLAVDEPMLIATVLDPDARRPAQIVGVSTEDGEVRWRRPAAARLGIPEAGGGIAVVGIGAQVVALGADTGREVARLDIGAPAEHRAELERVVHRRGMWFVGSGTRWVALGVGGQAHGLGRSYAPAFRTVQGMDDGHGDDERLGLWLRWSSVDASPRDAILLSRRAVVAARLDAEGNPMRPRWVHVEQGGEFVAMEVVGDRVILVREDGMIVQLADDDGRELHRLAGHEDAFGALVLGAEPQVRGGAHRHDDPRVIGDLRRLVALEDPRLLPAQRLATDLLWRSEDPRVRALVQGLADADVAGGTLAGGTERAAMLRDHARAVVRTPWGTGSDAEASSLLALLRARPRFGEYTAALEFSAPIRAAVRSGSPEVIAELGRLLLAPSTGAEDLVAIVEAFAILDDPRAVLPVAAFVTRYHADEQIVAESPALHLAARVLLQHVENGEALAVLRRVAEDPLCAPSLRTVIMGGLGELRVAAARRAGG